MQPLRRRLRRALLPSAAIVILAMPTQHADAQLSSAQQSALRANCRSDFMSHCSGTTPGGKDALVCLQKNVASLSPGCKAAVSATMPPPRAPKASPSPRPTPTPAATAAPPHKPASPSPRTTPYDALNKACGNAYLAHCASVPPGGKEALVCLRQHAMALSVPCKRVLSAMTAPAPSPKRAVRTAPPPLAPPAPVATGPNPKQLKALKFTCRRDFRIHCRGVPPSGADAFRCLARHSARLTPNCRTSVRAIEEGAPYPPAAAPVRLAPPPAQSRPTAIDAAVLVRDCKRDMFRHCRGVGPGGGRMLACLVAHSRSLSFRCRIALKVAGPLR